MRVAGRRTMWRPRRSRRQSRKGWMGAAAALGAMALAYLGGPELYRYMRMKRM